MTDLITMRAKIADEITRSDMASRITVAINDAIKLWEGERFAFNERRYLINTVAAQEYYELQAPDLLTHAGAAVPAGEMIIEIDSITSEQSNWPYPLTERTQQWMDRHQSSPLQYTGQPDSYAIYGNQLRLYPVPDIAYPIKISALARLGPNPVSADADTNDWFTEGEMLVREQAKVILFRFPLKDPDGMQLAQSGADNAYAGLKRKMAAKAGVGTMGGWRG